MRVPGPDRATTAPRLAVYPEEKTSADSALHEGRELLLELFVQLGVAGDKTRAGGSGTPYPQRLDTCLDDLRMPGKAQVVVGSQVDLGFGRAAGTQPST